MLRRGSPVEYSYSIKDSFYLEMLFLLLFFPKSKGGGGGDMPSPQPFPLRGPCDKEAAEVGN